MAATIGRRHRMALAGIVTVGVILRAWGLAWGLHNANVSVRPHPDEWTVYWLFTWFTRYGSMNPCPSAPTQCFFDWGMAFPMAAYAVHFVLQPLLPLLPSFGPRAQVSFVDAVIAGRITSLMASTLTILVVYRFALKIYGPIAGLLAALIVALSALLVQLAHFGTPDTVTGLLLTTALLSLYTAMDKPSHLRFTLSGFLIGAAIGSEYHMVLLVFPLLAAWFLCGRPAWTYLLGTGAAAAVAFAVINPYALVDIPDFLAAQEHTLRIRTVDSAAQYQGRWSVYGPSWQYVVHYALGYGAGLALSFWMLLGVLWGALRHRRAELLLLAWIVPYFVLVTLSPAKFMRYSAPLFPPVAVLAAGFAVQAFTARRRSAALLGVVAVVSTLIYDSSYVHLFTVPDPRALAAQWLQQHASPQTKVAFEELPNGLINMPYFATRAGFLPCFTSFDPKYLRGEMRYLVLDDYDLEEHPLTTTRQVQEFRDDLAADPDWEPVAHFELHPSALGISFPLTGSPHDWRYLDHVITIYRNRDPQPGGQCYQTIAAASAALHPDAAS